MDRLAWKTVSAEFAFDGGWRDIYVLDTDINVWQRVLDRIRHAAYDLVYYDGGNVSELPRTAVDAFPAEDGARRMLSIRVAEVLANCHFFTHDEIEFDIDPREVQGQRQLDGLLAFMQLLSDATGREAILTPENCREIVIFRSRPDQVAIEYHESGDWRNAE